MPRTIRKHILICNWNNRGETVIKELFQAFKKEQNLSIDVLTEFIPKDREDLQKKYKNFQFILGDPAIHDRLAPCKIHEKMSVIILADERNQDPDAQTALIALAAKKMCEEEGQRRPHIVAEALNHRKIQHLEDAEVNEIVCATEYGTGVIAQTAIHHGLATVYKNLLSYTDVTNEIYILEGADIPLSLREITFSEATEKLRQTRDSKNPVILIGIMRDGKPVINPIEKESMIKENDGLVVVAYHRPDISLIK